MHPIISILFKRIGLGIISLFFVTLIIFSSVNLLPGDFVESVLGQTRTEESVKIFRKELGLDKPYHVRYVNWLTSAIVQRFPTLAILPPEQFVNKSNKVIIDNVFIF